MKDSSTSMFQVDTSGDGERKNEEIEREWREARGVGGRHGEWEGGQWERQGGRVPSMSWNEIFACFRAMRLGETTHKVEFLKQKYLMVMTFLGGGAVSYTHLTLPTKTRV